MGSSSAVGIASKKLMGDVDQEPFTWEGSNRTF